LLGIETPTDCVSKGSLALTVVTEDQDKVFAGLAGEIEGMILVKRAPILEEDTFKSQ
jgi:hypothetical protein